jgi:predicted nuclease of restriction endonuclease-like RecB superfamily
MSESESAHDSPRGSILEQKWRYGIKLPADVEDLIEFTNWKIKVYTKRNWSNSNLSLCYSEDFEDFDSNTFRSIGKETQQALQDFLRSRGVYVQVGRGYSMADALIAAVKEELL